LSKSTERTGPLSVTREQVLGYRMAAIGLHRETAVPGRLAVLDIGIQDTPPGSARVAMAARLEDPRGGAVDPIDESVTAAWTFRSAPHFHRTADLPALAAALWPLSDHDAVTRMAGWASALKASGLRGLHALRETAEAIAGGVTEPTDKSAASHLVTERIRPELTRWCRGCEATHVFEDLFRAAAFQAGLKLDLSRSPIQLVPIEGWPGIPDRNHGVVDLIQRYLRLLGPAGPTEAASFLGSKPALIKPVWPQDLREVSVEGLGSWIPPEGVDALLNPPAPPAVRLLPPSDPYLQSRDREMIVPDPKRHSSIWKSIGSPGVLLVSGEILGTWRPKASAGTLALSLTTFGELPPETRGAVDGEAERVAGSRALRLASISYSTS
jgi:Winged helix DNA-binding domain